MLSTMTITDDGHFGSPQDLSSDIYNNTK